jgi:SAM-dependent methyltransferase
VPFAAGAFDLIWSNLAVSRHSRPDTVFPEWQRVLRVNGLLMFSTLGSRYAGASCMAWRTPKRRSARAARRARDRFRRARPWRHMLVEAASRSP